LGQPDKLRTTRQTISERKRCERDLCSEQHSTLGTDLPLSFHQPFSSPSEHAHYIKHQLHHQHSSKTHPPRYRPILFRRQNFPQQTHLSQSPHNYKPLHHHYLPFWKTHRLLAANHSSFQSPCRPSSHSLRRKNPTTSRRTSTASPTSSHQVTRCASHSTCTASTQATSYD